MSLSVMPMTRPLMPEGNMIIRAQNCPAAAGTRDIRVVQYVITRIDPNEMPAKGKPMQDDSCLLMKFVNQSEKTVSGLTCKIDQHDADGNLLCISTYELQGVTISPGKLYTPDKAVLLQSGCKDVRIRIRSWDVGQYRYHLREDGISVTFLPPDTRISPGADVTKKTKKQNTAPASAVNKVPVRYRPCLWAMIVTIVLLLALSAYFALYEYTSEPVHDFFTKTIPGALRAFFGDILPNALRAFFGDILPNALRAFFGDILPGALRAFFGRILPNALKELFGRIIPSLFKSIYEKMLYPLFHRPKTINP